MSGVAPRAAGAWSGTAAPHGGKRDEGWGDLGEGLSASIGHWGECRRGGVFLLLRPCLSYGMPGGVNDWEVAVWRGEFSWRRAWAAACT